jgi:hypothetical protein
MAVSGHVENLLLRSYAAIMEKWSHGELTTDCSQMDLHSLHLRVLLAEHSSALTTISMRNDRLPLLKMICNCWRQ